MENLIIDVMKRVGKELSETSNSACLVSVNYVEESNLYGTTNYSIDYGIAQKLKEGSLYVRYNSDETTCTVYQVKRKLIDGNSNIILIVDDDYERISFEEE